MSLRRIVYDTIYIFCISFFSFEKKLSRHSDSFMLYFYQERPAFTFTLPSSHFTDNLHNALAEYIKPLV